MAQFTEDEKIMRRLEQRFNKGVVKYRLIEDGDKILIGLSGGKDSLALLELLARRSRILKPKFAVIAVHVGMTNIPYQSDLEYLKGYSEDLGVPFVHYETFLIRVPTLGSLLVSFVLGIGEKLCSRWQRSKGAIRLL